MITGHTPTLSVGDIVELDDNRYVVDEIRSVVIGRLEEEVTVYDLEAITPDQDDLRSRTISEAYISYRLDSETATVSTGQWKLINHVRRLFNGK